MNSTIYKQYDSRWASLPYPTSTSPVSTDGCGLVAVTHCAIEVDKYKNYTPKDVISFMKQYAVAGSGTMFANPDGIAEGMKHYGLKDVKVISNMTDFWAELDKGDRIGIILFDKGQGPDGTIWTGARHFIAFNQYIKKGSKHRLYMKDSGGRDHDGWYYYEDSMKGCLYLMWTGRVPKNGWIKENGYWYYYEDGTPAKNKWAQDSSKKWFYLGADGKMAKAKWIKWKNEWYWVKSNGEMAASEWVKSSKGWCYLGADGKMLKAKWIRWKDNMYYVKEDGYMAVGEMTLPCKFSKSGKLEA